MENTFKIRIPNISKKYTFLQLTEGDIKGGAESEITDGPYQVLNTQYYAIQTLKFR
jgi:hypothetical protein